jgi:hypothetical protein
MPDDQVTIDPEFRPPLPDGDEGRWLKTIGVAAVVVAAFAFGWLVRTPEQVEREPDERHAAPTTTSTTEADDGAAPTSSTTRPSATTTTEPPEITGLAVPLSEAVPGFADIVTVEHWNETGVDVVRWRSTQPDQQSIASFGHDESWWFSGLDASGSWYALQDELRVLAVHRTDGDDPELPWSPGLQTVGVRVDSVAWHDTAPGQLAWLACSRTPGGPGMLYRLDVADSLAEPTAVRSVDRVCAGDGGTWLNAWGAWGFSLGTSDGDRHETVVLGPDGTEIGPVGDGTLDTWLQTASPLGTIWTEEGPNARRSFLVSPDGKTTRPLPGLEEGEWFYEALWSADGTHLALAVHRSEDDSPTIRILEMPSGETVAEFSEPVWETNLGAWSRDGRFLVYTGFRCTDGCGWTEPEEWALGFFDTETTINTALPLPTSPGGGWVGNTRISSANMPVDLVAHCPLDGDVAEVGDHVDGGFVVGATPTSDRFGAPDSAYAFDGEGDRIVMDRGSHLAVDTVSIAAWIRMDDDTAPRPIEEWWGVVSYLGKGYVLAIQGDGAAIGGLRGSAGDCTFAGSDTVFDGDWHHVAMTRDANWVVRVYLDGVLQITTSTTVDADGADAAIDSVCPGSPATFGESVWIGGDLAEAEHFHGSIDDVRIYSGVLSEDEIAALAADTP